MDAQIKYRALVETIRKGSLTAAAESLGYTQPGISRMIRSLEEEWGICLLERNRTGIIPTEDGKRMFSLCQELLEKQKQIDDTIAQIKGSVAGTVRIGGYYSVLMNWMPDILKHIQNTFPMLEFQIFEGNAEEQIEMLRSSEIDVGFLSSSAPDDFTFIPLYRDPIVVVMPMDHPLTAFEVIEPEMLSSYPFLIKPEHSFGMLKSLLLQYPSRMESHYSVKTDNALIGLVNKGLGIGVVGEMVTRCGAKVESRPLCGEYYRTIGMAVPNWKTVSPALRHFISEVQSMYLYDQSAKETRN